MATSSPAGEGNLTNVIDQFVDEGFTEHFAVREERLVGLETGTQFVPAEVIIRRVERFEGVSDPDDMSVVYAIESRSGIRGTLTDAFGVYANPAVSEFVDKVERSMEIDQQAACARTDPPHP